MNYLAGISGIFGVAIFLLLCILVDRKGKELQIGFNDFTISKLGENESIRIIIQYLGIPLSLLNIIFTFSFYDIFGNVVSNIEYFLFIICSLSMVVSVMSVNKPDGLFHRTVSWIFFVTFVIEELLIAIILYLSLGPIILISFGVILLTILLILFLYLSKKARENGVIEISFLGVNMIWVLIVSFILLLVNL